MLTKAYIYFPVILNLKNIFFKKIKTSNKFNVGRFSWKMLGILSGIHKEFPFADASD